MRVGSLRRTPGGGHKIYNGGQIITDFACSWGLEKNKFIALFDWILEEFVPWSRGNKMPSDY
jgi:hypothetical protein